MGHNEGTYGNMERRSLFNDRRLDRRYFHLMDKIVESESVNISRISSGRNEQISFYRFLGNEKVSEARIIRTMKDSCLGKVEEGVHYLLLSDSTDMSLQNHSRRLKVSSSEKPVIGPINELQMGFFLHPVLAMEPESQRCLGFSSVHIWSRDPEGKKARERRYKSLFHVLFFERAKLFVLEKLWKNIFAIFF